jgi:glycosyltransferase involved in cell wall biosynthesis
VVVLHEGRYAVPSIPLWREGYPTAHLVLYVHNPLSRSYRGLELRRLLRNLDGMVFVSRDALAEAHHRLGGIRVPTDVVRNGVDTRIFSPAGREASEAFRIAFVGELAPHKGPHLLLAAAKHLPTMTDRKVAVRLVGGGVRPGRRQARYEEQVLRELTRLPFPTSHIARLPHEQVPDILRWADLVCVPSLWREPFGMIALESLACGAVVIASPVGGLREAVGDAACFVDPRDELELARTIVRLMENEELVEEWRARGIAHAQAHTWTSGYEQLRHVVTSWTQPV